MKFERFLRRWSGLEPRRPERLLVVAAAAAIAAIVLLTAGIFALCGELYWYSPRKDYFLYLFVLAVLAAVLAAWPRVAAILLGLALVDLGLGLGSLLLSRTGAGVSVMPDNFYAGGGFEWHPLLQGVPVPSLKGGYGGLTITHSAAGTRGRDYSRDELAGKSVVAAIGGSTTYDLGVTDSDTWTTRLEQLLGGGAARQGHLGGQGERAGKRRPLARHAGGPCAHGPQRQGRLFLQPLPQARQLAYGRQAGKRMGPGRV